MKRLVILIILSFLSLITACNSGSSSSTAASFAITSISPQNNTVINITQTFTANFNYAVNSTSLGGIQLVDQTSNLAVTINCNLINPTSVSCKPSNDLDYGTSYKLNFTNQVSSVAQNHLNPVSYDYTTITSPSVVQVQPANNTDVGITLNIIKVYFSESMNLNTLNNSITPGIVTFNDILRNTVPLNCIAVSSQQMSCTIINHLNPNSGYIFTLTDQIVSALNVALTPETINYNTNLDYNWVKLQSGNSSDYQVYQNASNTVYSYVDTNSKVPSGNFYSYNLDNKLIQASALFNVVPITTADGQNNTMTFSANGQALVFGRNDTTWHNAMYLYNGSWNSVSGNLTNGIIGYEGFDLANGGFIINYQSNIYYINTSGTITNLNFLNPVSLARSGNVPYVEDTANKIYTYTNSQWNYLTQSPLKSASITASSNGDIVASSYSLTNLAYFNFANKTWSIIALPDNDLAAVTINPNYIVASFSGNSNSYTSDHIWVYSLAKKTWQYANMGVITNTRYQSLAIDNTNNIFAATGAQQFSNEAVWEGSPQ